MSYKTNLKFPLRRAQIKARHAAYRQSGAVSQIPPQTLYVPGNGSEHRLGRADNTWRKGVV